MVVVVSSIPVYLSEKWQDRPRLLLGNCTRAFDWCRNQRSWMTLNGSVSKYMSLQEPITKTELRVFWYGAVQGHPRSLISASIESACATSY